MLNKINSINQYILERYPNIWNTKLLWMLAIGAIIHLLFYFLGYIWYSNPERLQLSSAEDAYFSDGLIYIQCIISLILIVVWATQLFKNNAFKNFYPISVGKLFTQFLHTFIILFVSISFYFSFISGARSFISGKYDDETMIKKTAIINQAMAFLPYDIEFYTVENRINPTILETYYCETNPQNINSALPTLSYKGRVYQYYSLSKETSTKMVNGYFVEPRPNQTSVRQIDQGKSRIFYYKDKVVDVSSYFKTLAPSFYNYSLLFSDRPDYYEAHYATKEDVSYNVSKESKVIVQKNAELLSSNDKAKMKQLFDEFFKISNEYKIKSNLNSEKLVNLAYNPDAYPVNFYIKHYSPSQKTDGYYYNGYDVTEQMTNGQMTELEKELEQNMTPYFYNDSELKNLLDNVSTIKNKELLTYSFMSLVGIAFGLALILLCFRLTGLKPLIFGAIAIGVSVLFLVLLNVVVLSVFARIEMVYYTTTLGLYLLYVVTGFIGFNKLSKKTLAVIINVVLLVLPGMIAMAIFAISHLQTLACEAKKPIGQDYLQYCPTLIESLDYWTLYVVILISLPIIYGYLHFVQKWKARPE